VFTLTSPPDCLEPNPDLTWSANFDAVSGDQINFVIQFPGLGEPPSGSHASTVASIRPMNFDDYLPHMGDPIAFTVVNGDDGSFEFIWNDVEMPTSFGTNPVVSSGWAGCTIP